jgi:hypothetical protein
VYVAGYTVSSDFPTTAGAFDGSFNGGVGYGDAFISKLSGDLTQLLASTYLGGGDDEGANALALDSAGNVYVAGYTVSSDFPTTAGAFDESFNGAGIDYGDAFISKLSGDLTQLLASTFLGGDRGDCANALALDNAGNVYVAGKRGSTNFPTTAGAFDENGYGGTFISKLSGDLTQLLASTYLGGGWSLCPCPRQGRQCVCGGCDR